MQCESGSGGNEDARTHEAGLVQIVPRTETRAWTQAQAEAEAGVWARAHGKVQALVWMRAQALPAEVRARPQARAEALIRALAPVWAQVVDKGKISPERAMALLVSAQYKQGTLALPGPREAILPHPYAPPYAEVLADLRIKAILDSIKPSYLHELARVLWPQPEHLWLIQILAPVTRLPLELLQSILSIVIDEGSPSPVALMLVCKRWYTSVTDIWASLNLGTRTSRDTVTKRLERNQMSLDIFIDTEINRGGFTPSKGAYEGIFAAIEATSRWRSLVVETFPGQADLPEHLVSHGLRRCSTVTMSRLKTFKVKSACERSPLLDRLLCILGTTASVGLTTVEINSANVISFLLPTYSPIFRSVKVLFLDISEMHDPVDLLPHLYQLETLTASHLSLPIYGHDINLPFVNTLRHLRLRAVSIQWMSGRTFRALESCTIRFPLHRHIPHIFSTTLPNCKHLTFQGYPLDILYGVSAHKLIHLSVTSPSSSNRGGARQLDWISSQVLGESRLAPRVLHISIEATSQAWINALTFMPHLEELVIENTKPSSLMVKVLQSIIAQPVHTNNLGAISAAGEWHAPLCPSLKRFGLKYRRWLRTSERFDLIPKIVSIIRRRQHLKCALQSFRIWTRSDQEDPLELVEESWISVKGFERLAKEMGIKVDDVLELVLSALTFKLHGVFQPTLLIITASTVSLVPMELGGSWEVAVQGQGLDAGQAEVGQQTRSFSSEFTAKRKFQHSAPLGFD